MQIAQIIDSKLKNFYFEIAGNSCRSYIWKKIIRIGLEKEVTAHFTCLMGTIFIVRGKRKFFAFFKNSLIPDFNAFCYNLGEMDLVLAYKIIKDLGEVLNKESWLEFQKKLAADAL